MKFLWRNASPRGKGLSLVGGIQSRFHPGHHQTFARPCILASTLQNVETKLTTRLLTCLVYSTV